VLVFLWAACTEPIEEIARRSQRVIHPLQYELETARHLDGQRQAAQHRMVAEADKLASGHMQTVRFLRSPIGWFDWRVIRATFVRGGTA
jgi:hypothetical protein